MNFYDKNAKDYREKTLKVDMTDVCNRFLSHLSPGAKVLDLGAGSGRDAMYFREQGHKVTAIDSSAELVKLALNERIEMTHLDFLEMTYADEFDAVWASASLVHLHRAELSVILNSIYRALKPNGYFYTSFKEGVSQGNDEQGRFFSYYQQPELEAIFNRTGLYEVKEVWSSADGMKRPESSWINLIVKKV